jgi:hypothetical protein
LRRGVVGGGALLVAGSGLSGIPGVASAIGVASAATPPPAGDLAYLRLLIAAELLALDFHDRALGSGKLKHPAAALARQIRADEHDHYVRLAGLMVAAGQTPATAADIDFSYPAGSFAGQGSIVKLAEKLERLLLGAYLGAAENVETPELRVPIGQIVANEAQHGSALAALQGRPVIGKPFAAPPLQIAEVSNQLGVYES